jgi:secretion/DNA translocation related TadE-like protein
MVAARIRVAPGERDDAARVRVTADGFGHGSVDARASPAARPASDRGSITLLCAGVLAAVVVLAMGASDVARVLHAASRAQTAADAAALAAAQALAFDEEGPEPSALAGEYAERNGAVLETCSCERGTFEATVSVRLPVGDLFLFAGDRTVQARASAQVDLPAP